MLPPPVSVMRHVVVIAVHVIQGAPAAGETTLSQMDTHVVVEVTPPSPSSTVRLTW